MRITGPRIPCVVPFCRRTASAEKYGDNAEIICRKCYARVSRETKATFRLTKRRLDKILSRKPMYREYWKLPPGSPARCAAANMWRRMDQVWARVKAEATEGAAGIN